MSYQDSPFWFNAPPESDAEPLSGPARERSCVFSRDYKLRLSHQSIKIIILVAESVSVSSW